MLDLLKNTQDSLSPWLNVVGSLKKLCQAVVVKNDQENLQPTLNKRAGGASLTIFVTGCTLQSFCILGSSCLFCVLNQVSSQKSSKHFINSGVVLFYFFFFIFTKTICQIIKIMPPGRFEFLEKVSFQIIFTSKDSFKKKNKEQSKK